MKGSDPFEWLCDELHQRTNMSRLEARGTVRLALKEAGLTPGGAMRKPLAIVVERVLTPMLERRGIDNAARLGLQLARVLELSPDEDLYGDDSPEAVFGRMGA